MVAPVVSLKRIVFVLAAVLPPQVVVPAVLMIRAPRMSLILLPVMLSGPLNCVVPVPLSVPPVQVDEPKKVTKKQEVRTAPRRARPVREQPNPFWGYASSRSFGFRPGF